MHRSVTWIIAAVLIASVGCGGGEAEGPSLDAQVKKAMSNPVPQSRAGELIRVAARQREAGDFAGSARSLDAAAEAAKLVESPATRVESLCLVVDAQDKAGSSTGAQDLLKAASRAVDEIAAPADKAAALSQMAAAYGNTLKDMDIAGIYLKNAEEEAAKIESPLDKALALLKLASAQSQLANSEAATRLIEQGLELARGIADPRQRCEALATAGETLSKMKLVEEGKAAFGEAQAEAAKITEPLNQSYAYLEIANRMVNVGLSNAATETLDKARVQADKVEASLRRDLLDAIDRANSRL